MDGDDGHVVWPLNMVIGHIRDRDDILHSDARHAVYNYLNQHHPFHFVNRRTFG